MYRHVLLVLGLMDRRNPLVRIGILCICFLGSHWQLTLAPQLPPGRRRRRLVGARLQMVGLGVVKADDCWELDVGALVVLA